MDVVLFTPAHLGAREMALLPKLAASGIVRLHARWPAADERQARCWLEEFPDTVRKLTVLHQHHTLAGDYGVLGVHDKDRAERTPEALTLEKRRPEETTPERGAFRSRACHNPGQLALHYGAYDTLIAAPVFPSLSKPGHDPVVADWKIEALKKVRPTTNESRTRLCALGGIDAGRVAASAQLGFDEVAVLGAVWQSAQPLGALARILTEARRL